MLTIHKSPVTLLCLLKANCTKAFRFPLNDSIAPKERSTEDPFVISTKNVGQKFSWRTIILQRYTVLFYPSLSFRSVRNDVGVGFGEACFSSWTCRDHAGMSWRCSSLCSAKRTVWPPNWGVPVHTGLFSTHLPSLLLIPQLCSSQLNILKHEPIFVREKSQTCIPPYNLQGAVSHSSMFLLPLSLISMEPYLTINILSGLMSIL